MVRLVLPGQLLDAGLETVFKGYIKGRKHKEKGGKHLVRLVLPGQQLDDGLGPFLKG